MEQGCQTEISEKQVLKNQLRDIRDIVIAKPTLLYVRAAVARGWCHPETEKKVMDVTLAEAISKEVMEMIDLMFKP